jgi:hypothetical protein
VAFYRRDQREILNSDFQVLRALTK